MASLPTLDEVKVWFDKTILPKRGASAGFSLNRVVKGPRAMIRRENTPDPDGLCGDVTQFVYDEFVSNFGDEKTSDGFRLGCIKWDGLVFNHIANVMLVQGRPGQQTYTYDQKASKVLGDKTTQKYFGNDLLNLQVLDLYYKTRSDIRFWWNQRDKMGGKVTIGKIYEM